MIRARPSMASQKNYYDILGVRRGATEEEIEKAYHRLTRTHPYAPPPSQKTGEFRFKEILEAYEILSNKARRERYDRTGVELPPPDFLWEEEMEEEEEEGLLEGFEDVLEAGLRSSGKIHQAEKKGKDLRFNLDIEFESAVRGTVTQVQVLQEIPCKSCAGRGLNLRGPQRVCRQCGGAGQVQVGLPPSAFFQPCGRCEGKGKIRIQPCRSCSGKGLVARRKRVSLRISPGVNDRCRLFLSGLGHMGPQGKRGDLIAEIRVGGHPYFERKGDDLHLEVPLDIWEAALGTVVEVPTLNGPYRLKVPPGVQPGDQLRLSGRGVPFLQGNGQGDQVITFAVRVPREIDARSRKLLQELKKKNSSDPRAECGWRRKS